MSEPTHDPTPKRLDEARRKGDVPQAPLVAGALGLLVAVPLLRGMVEGQVRELQTTFADPRPMYAIDPWSVGRAVLAGVAPITAVLAAIAVAAAVVQGSFVFSPSRLSPDPSRLEPFGGLGRLIDKPRLWSSLRGLVVLALGGAVITRTVMRSAADGARAHDPARLLHAASTVATSITIAIATIACLAAIADAIVGRRLWFGRLKMTREEVIREQKEGDGDPEIKRRREELHHELVASEAVAAVRDASVVVINPTHLACALRYDAAGGEEAAPTLVAKGHGALAERIVAAARQHGVPVVRDVPVARALVELEIGTEIPEALYEAVAEVLHAAWNGE